MRHCSNIAAGTKFTVCQTCSTVILGYIETTNAEEGQIVVVLKWGHRLEIDRIATVMLAVAVRRYTTVRSQLKSSSVTTLGCIGIIME